MPTTPRSPFDLTLDKTRRDELGAWLTREIDNALNARSASEQDVAYWHLLYEQGRTRTTNSPWPDAADLTSPIATEKVDALRARVVKTIFSDNIWTVEGWGDSAEKAPFVEEFHQWQAEAEGFQGVFSRVVQLSLIEPRGVMEVYEDRLRRPVRKQIRAKIRMSADGAALLDEDLKPVFELTSEGGIVEVSGPDPQTGQEAPSAETVIDSYELVANGPRERAIPYRDFLMLPAHASERSQLWGQAKRFWRRVDDLRERIDQGIYDRGILDDIGDQDERASEQTLSGQEKEIAQKEPQLSEKELWEVTFLKELDRTGARWFVATVHRPSQSLLRLQYDDIGRSRYFAFTPFPREDSTEGYSFIGHKLITVIEENTAWRNMLADRASLQLQAPIQREQGALWDPDEEPIGPKAVLTVRRIGEIAPLQIPDYTAPARERILDTERQAEKLAGISDIASASQPTHDRTLGETQMIMVASEVRTDEVIRNIQETLEEVAQVRHLMWKRALTSQPEGLEMPDSVLQGLETRGVDVTRHAPNRRFVAHMLDGAFRFKPKGSVETADRQRQRFDFNQSLQALANLSRANPMIAMILQQPKVAKALLERWVQLYNVPDKQAFLGSEAMAVLAQPPVTPGLPIAGTPGLPGQPPLMSGMPQAPMAGGIQ